MSELFEVDILYCIQHANEGFSYSNFCLKLTDRVRATLEHSPLLCWRTTLTTIHMLSPSVVLYVSCNNTPSVVLTFVAGYVQQNRQCVESFSTIKFKATPCGFSTFIWEFQNYFYDWFNGKMALFPLTQCLQLALYWAVYTPLVACPAPPQHALLCGNTSHTSISWLQKAS